VVVRVIDDIHEVPALRKERSDLPIVPSGDNTAPVIRKPNAEALQVWHLDPKQLLPIPRIPDPNVIDRACGKQLAIPIGKRDIIDLLVMAGVAQLGLEDVRVYPVDVAEQSSTEEVSPIGCR
jgi:hypothetical protein